MEKFSVKKPFTILVMVIIMIALGVQALTNMAPDLLPEFSLPYMMVIAPYPGASPEKVETTVARPLESALGTVNGVKNVSSVSSENYALIQLEFQTGTDMNGALVRVNSALQEAESLLPTGTMTPTLMEISLDMVATMYTAVSDQDLDIYELSSYVEDRIIPYIERQDGVASVNPIGLIEQTIQVDLDQKKIDKLNDKILAQVNKALAEAQPSWSTSSPSSAPPSPPGSSPRWTARRSPQRRRSGSSWPASSPASGRWRPPWCRPSPTPSPRWTTRRGPSPTASLPSARSWSL